LTTHKHNVILHSLFTCIPVVTTACDLIGVQILLSLPIGKVFQIKGKIALYHRQL